MRRTNERAGIARATILVALLAGCSAPNPVEVPRLSGVVLDSASVVWTTSQPSLGAVRFGDRPSAYRAVAYPAAAGRGDKTLTANHRVTLLTASVGDTVYLQLLDTSPFGSVTRSQEFRFVVAARTPPRPLLVWTMIDVGFGDSHLITLPTTGRRVLIDAGERRDWPNVDRFLQDSGIDRLDAVLATHIHADHIGGLVGESSSPTDGVLGEYEVGVLLDGPNHSGSRAAYDELLALAARRGIPRQVVSAGDTDASRPALAWDPAVQVVALNGGGGRAIGGESENDWINNDSIVLRLTYGEVSFILGGDAEAPVESRLVSLGGPLDSEVLKVHHHGVDDSSVGPYLSAVNPRVGLIPITTFESGSGTLPSFAVLDRLHQRLIDVYASDRAEPLGVLLTGNAGHHVTVVTDGISYQVSIEPSRSVHFPGGTVASHAEGCSP